MSVHPEALGHLHFPYLPHRTKPSASVPMSRIKGFHLCVVFRAPGKSKQSPFLRLSLESGSRAWGLSVPRGTL